MKTHKQKYNEWHNRRKDDIYMEEVEYYKTLGLILKGKKSVDIGCGYGSISMFSPETVGVDISDEALKRAKKLGVKKVVRASAENLPFKKNEFEIAVSVGVLEHIENQEKAISEMVRVSEMQILVVHAALPFGLEYLRRPLLALFGHTDQPVEKPFTLRKIKRLLKRNGSRVIVEGVWNYIDLRWLHNKIPYGLVKWPSHHFTISLKTKNLERKFLGNTNLTKKR